MNKKIYIWGAFLLLFLITMNIAFFAKFKNDKYESPTASVIADPIIYPAGEIVIEKDDLKKCCTFETDGTPQSCYVLERYSCDHCAEFCTIQ
ncbi:MAG: hypothetical protein ABIJ21_04200 [Nanoarchaeota archaeon]